MIKKAYILRDNNNEACERTVLLNDDQLAMLGWLNKTWGCKYSCTLISSNPVDVTPEKYMLAVSMP